MKSHGKSKAVLTAIIFEVNLLQSSRFGEALDVPADVLIRDSAAPASYVADDELNRKLSRLTPGQKKAATDILNAYIDNIPYIKEK